MPSFKRNGTMIDDTGRVVKAAWRMTYESRSEAGKIHTATRWKNGFVSCNCKGWVFNHDCWHARDITPRRSKPLRVVEVLQPDPARLRIIDMTPTVQDAVVEYSGREYIRRIQL